MNIFEKKMDQKEKVEKKILNCPTTKIKNFDLKMDLKFLGSKLTFFFSKNFF
jgi:hypothetical protein